MAIITSTFGGVRLTGKDAVAFTKQFLTGKRKPNPLLQQALVEGEKMFKELQRKGYVRIKPNNKR